MKKSTPNLLLALIILAIPFGYAAYLYPSLPATIPTHFNIKGEADGFGGRDSIFLVPSIMGAVGLFSFFLLSNIKNFDPKIYQNQDDGMLKKMALFIVLFLSLLGLIITFSATNHSINITKLLLPCIGFALAGLGWYMPKLHQNYFAGFRLPWTLENIDNWNATHKVAGKIWLIGGLIQVVTSLLLDSKWAFIAFMGITAVMVIIPSLFSYRMFKNSKVIE